MVFVIIRRLVDCQSFIIIDVGRRYKRGYDYGCDAAVLLLT
jgi:hypothetical protein